MSQEDSNNGHRCPIMYVQKIIGMKWKPAIIWHLMQNPLRFNEIQRSLPDITQTVLTRQLRELEGDGLITRKVFPEVPPKVEYSITELGLTLAPLLETMCNWGIMYMDVRGLSHKIPGEKIKNNCRIR